MRLCAPKPLGLFLYAESSLCSAFSSRNINEVYVSFCLTLDPGLPAVTLIPLMGARSRVHCRSLS